MRASALIAMLLVLGCRCAPEPPPVDLATTAEKSAYRETGTYDEVDRLCHGFESRFPGKASCFAFGTTPEKRTIWALAVSKAGALDAATARARGLPIVLVQGGIHAGEIDGKDAGFQLLRGLLDGSIRSDALEKLVVVFVPVFNVDGHESRGKFQRPNQNGPLEQGLRTTAHRLNLNRQYMIADAPELRSMLALLDAWDPLLLLDLHVTDGARFQHEVALSVGPDRFGSPALAAKASSLRDDVVKVLEAGGHHPVPFYPRLLDVDDPGQGFVLDVDAPRHSQAYWGLRNRLGVLVEDHSWRPFEQRVRVCRDTILAYLERVARRAPELVAATQAADAETAALAGKEAVLAYETIVDPVFEKPPASIDFLGYRYELLERAPVTGGPGLVYHPDEPQTWHVPLHADIRPVEGSRVPLPGAGYVVPPAWADVVAPVLRAHGVEFTVRTTSLSDVSAEVVRVDPDEVEYDDVSFQGRQTLRLEGEWKAEAISVAAGSLYVPISQARGLLAAHLLEPASPDSLSSWGVFNTAYEPSDYVTNYRRLELARWMHDADPRIRTLYGEVLFGRLPELRKAFDVRLAADPVFAADPDARLDYWTSALPPQDAQLGLYPVVRVARPLP